MTRTEKQKRDLAQKILELKGSRSRHTVDSLVKFYSLNHLKLEYNSLTLVKTGQRVRVSGFSDPATDEQSDFDGYFVGAGSGDPKGMDFKWIEGGDTYEARQDISVGKWNRWIEYAAEVGLTLEIVK